MRWPESFHAVRAGRGCPACAEGRPDATEHGVRWLAGETADAYLVRADIQRGLSVVVFRGRHVVEPTELTEAEAAAYGRDVLRAGRAIEEALGPVKMNYTLLGNAMPHLHTHVIPRYADDPRPGWPFPFPDPDPRPMSDDRLMADLELLKATVR
jgi:diadenosine tetraphosphate (Ap4A) HIT family hydrolase